MQGAVRTEVKKCWRGAAQCDLSDTSVLAEIRPYVEVDRGATHFFGFVNTILFSKNWRPNV